MRAEFLKNQGSMTPKQKAIALEARYDVLDACVNVESKRTPHSDLLGNVGTDWIKDTSPNWDWTNYIFRII